MSTESTSPQTTMQLNRTLFARASGAWFRVGGEGDTITVIEHPAGILVAGPGGQGVGDADLIAAAIA